MKKIFTLVAAIVMGIGAVSAQGFSSEVVAGMNVANWGGLGNRIGFHAI